MCFNRGTLTDQYHLPNLHVFSGNHSERNKYAFKTYIFDVKLYYTSLGDLTKS